MGFDSERVACGSVSEYDSATQMAETSRPCRGEEGAASSIDLRKASDLNLVHRAVVNGWPVSEPVRHGIVEQLDAALADIDATPGQARRGRRVVKLAKLFVLMDAVNMIDEGHLRSHFPYLRKRYAESRRPRRERRRRGAGIT